MTTAQRTSASIAVRPPRQESFSDGRQGADVMCVSRNADLLAGTADEIGRLGGRAEWMAASLRGEDAIGEVVRETSERLGGIDILVNNAADDHDSSIPDTDIATWRRVVELNLESCFLLCRESGEYLMAQGHQRMLYSVSGRGLRQCNVHRGQGGVIAFTRGLAVEWACKGVQVNALCPGFIRTDMTSGLWETEAGSQWVTKRTPVGRWGAPEDLVGAVVFLASRASDFMTGQSIVVPLSWTVVGLRSKRSAGSERPPALTRRAATKASYWCIDYTWALASANVNAVQVESGNLESVRRRHRGDAEERVRRATPLS